MSEMRPMRWWFADKLVGCSCVGIYVFDREADGRFEERDAGIVVVVCSRFDRGFSDILVVERDGEMVGVECAEKIAARNEGVRLEELAIRAGVVCGEKLPSFEEHFGSGGFVRNGDEREGRNEWVGMILQKLFANVLAKAFEGVGDVAVTRAEFEHAGVALGNCGHSFSDR